MNMLCVALLTTVERLQSDVYSDQLSVLNENCLFDELVTYIWLSRVPLLAASDDSCFAPVHFVVNHACTR
jgi:hypothetical protein